MAKDSWHRTDQTPPQSQNLPLSPKRTPAPAARPPTVTKGMEFRLIPRDSISRQTRRSFSSSQTSSSQHARPTQTSSSPPRRGARRSPSLSRLLPSHVLPQPPSPLLPRLTPPPLHHQILPPPPIRMRVHQRQRKKPQRPLQLPPKRCLRLRPTNQRESRSSRQHRPAPVSFHATSPLAPLTPLPMPPPRPPHLLR